MRSVPARFFALAASLAALLMLVGAARAQVMTTVPIAVPTMSLNGTVTQILPNQVVLSYNGFAVSIPAGTTQATYYVNGAVVPVSGLTVGMPVRTTFTSLNGNLTGYDNGMVTIMTPQGPVVVPYNALPASVQGKTRVPVQLPNGNVVTVPMNAAMNMQRSQGATILWNGQGNPNNVYQGNPGKANKGGNGNSGKANKGGKNK